MKFIILTLLLSFSSCVKKDFIEKTNEKHQKEVVYDVLIENSSEKEFNNTNITLPLFKPFDTDTIVAHNIHRVPIEIETKSKKIKLSNISPMEEDLQVNYFYLGFNGQLKKHLVYVIYYEHREFLLIDDETAKTYIINGIPCYSPDKSKFISYYINPYEEMETEKEFVFSGTIEIYISDNDNIKLIEKQSFDFIPMEIRWKNNSTILIKAIHSSDYEKYPVLTTNDYLYKKMLIVEK